MKFYHGTSQANWKKIQEEKMLWGIRNAPSRCTYLAVDEEEARCHGEVVLEVEYEPGSMTDNYFADCWQFRVYGSILIKDVRKISKRE